MRGFHSAGPDLSRKYVMFASQHRVHRQPPCVYDERSAFAADAVVIAVEAVRIWKEHGEASKGDVAAVEIGW